MGRMASMVLIGLAGLLSACGGGGGDGGPVEPGPLPAVAPDVALVLVSGHEGVFDAKPSRSYLDDQLGPALAADLRAAGLTVEVFYGVDHWTRTDHLGYVELVDLLVAIRDEWVFGTRDPTDVVVVSHSHGGVWATAAIRQVGNLPIAAHVALDHSSYAWETTGHASANSLIGGDPRNAYSIAQLVSYPQYPGVPSEQTPFYDLEDVVMPPVVEALEVRSMEGPPFAGELYDERWNIRTDATTTGLFGYFSADSHTEARLTTGGTYPLVLGWLLDRL